MRVKVKTDRHGLPMWLLWSRRINAFKLHFCSHKHVFKDDRWFCKNCYQQGQIVYQTPMFHQYLF